jgi:predicted dehydrogenase
MTKTKVLFVGLGGIGQRHLRNLRRICGDSLEVCALRTRRLNITLTDSLQVESGADLESKYHVRVVTAVDDALAFQPRYAFICNPSSLHVPVALALAQAGVHLFIEKPLSHDLYQVQELIEVVLRKQLIGFVGYQFRFHPCVQRLREIVSSGIIGRSLAARVQVGEYLPNWHQYEDYRQMYASKAELGGGVILSQIHELDYLFWLFGVPKNVYTVGGHLSPLEIDVEDVASSLFRFEQNGFPVPVSLLQDYVQRPSSRDCSIIGEEGRVHLDLTKNQLLRFDISGQLVENLEIVNLQRNDLFINETRHFLDCVEGKNTPLVSLGDGAQSLRMALATKLSLKEQRIVSLIEL